MRKFIILVVVLFLLSSSVSTADALSASQPFLPNILGLQPFNLKSLRQQSLLKQTIYTLQVLGLVAILKYLQKMVGVSEAFLKMRISLVMLKQSKKISLQHSNFQISTLQHSTASLLLIMNPGISLGIFQLASIEMLLCSMLSSKIPTQTFLLHNSNNLQLQKF